MQVRRTGILSDGFAAALASALQKTAEPLPLTPESAPAPAPAPEEKKPEAPSISLGQPLLGRLAQALGHAELKGALKNHDYKDFEAVLREELMDIARDHKKGDWVSMPDGTTYTLTFKPQGQL